MVNQTYNGLNEFDCKIKKYVSSGCFTKPKEQRGVVLVVSLVFLIALTAVASALMLNTTTDMKMSGASEEKFVAYEEAFSAMDELIFRQVNLLTGKTNIFASPIKSFQGVEKDVLVDLTKTNVNVTSATVSLSNNQFVLEAPCPHSRNASSTKVFTCNVLRAQVNKNYGRQLTSTVQVESGIAQQLLR